MSETALICPHCGSNRTAWKAKSRIWECLDCENYIDSIHSENPQDPTVLSHANEDHSQLQRLLTAVANAPPPICETVNDYLKETQFYRRSQFIPYILEQSLRYLSVVMVGDFLAMPATEGTASGRERISSALSSLFQPSLGSWNNLLQSFYLGILASAEQNQPLRPFFTEFTSIYRKVQELPKRRVLNHKSYQEESRQPMQALLAFRNAMAHAPSPLSDEDAKACELLYLPCLIDVLECFEPIYQGYSLHLCCCPPNYTIDPGVSVEVELKSLDNETETERLHLRLLRGHCAQNSLIILRRCLDVDSPALAIPFLFWTLSTPVERLAVFDGICSSKVIYAGARRKLQDAHYRPEILGLLENCQVTTRVDRKRFSINALSLVMNNRSRATLEASLVDRAYAREDIGYVERRIDRELRDFLAGYQPLMFIVAEAGSGKTSLCCHIVDSLLPKIECDSSDSSNVNAVFFIRGKELHAARCAQHIPLFTIFASECLRRTDFDNFIDLFDEIGRHIADGAWRFCLVVDAVNEAHSPGMVLKELQSLLKVLREPGRDISWLKIVVTMRREALAFLREAGYTEGNFGRVGGSAGGALPREPDPLFYLYEHEARLSPEVPLTRFTLREMECALARTNAPHSVAVDLFAHDASFIDFLSLPLNLRLYLDLLRSTPEYTPRDECDLFASFDNLWVQGAEQTIRSKKRRFLADLLDLMLHSNQNQVDVDAASELAEYGGAPSPPELTPLQQLLEAGMLVRIRGQNGASSIGFALQKQLEYQIAKRLEEIEGNDSAAQTDALVDALQRGGFDELIAARQRQLVHGGCELFLSKVLPQFEQALQQSAIDRKTLCAVLDQVLIELVQRTDCNAIFIEELVKRLGAHGLLSPLRHLLQLLIHAARTNLAATLIDALLAEQLEPEERLDALQASALLAANSGDFSNATKLLQKAREIPCRNPMREVLIDIEEMKYLRQNGRLDLALARAEEIKSFLNASELIPRERDIALSTLDEQRALCLAARASIDDELSSRDSLLQEALRCSTAAADLANATEAHELFVYCSIGRAARLQDLGKLNDAAESFRTAADAANLRGMFHLFLDAQNGLARNFIMTARCAPDRDTKLRAYSEAKSLAEAVLRYWTGSGFVRGQLVLHTYLFEAAAALGEVTLRLRHHDAALRLLERINEQRLHILFTDAQRYVQNNISSA